MSLHDLIRKLKYGPNRLPSSSNEGGQVTVPGLGTFGFQGVGNTSYSQGIWVYFQAEGDDEPAAGYLAFKAVITADLNPVWEITGNTIDYGDYTGERFGSRVWETARELMNTIHMRRENPWFFNMESAIRREMSDVKRAFENLDRSKFLLEEMLAGKVQHTRSKDDLVRSLASTIHRLAKLHLEQDSRQAALKAGYLACHQWSGMARKRPAIRDHLIATLSRHGMSSQAGKNGAYTAPAFDSTENIFAVPYDEESTVAF